MSDETKTHKKSEDIARLFTEDIINKKVINRSNFSRVRAGGKYVRLPFESLQGKARRDYTKSSEVKTYRMIETLTYEDLKKMPQEEARRYFTELVEKHNNKEIASKLGVSGYKIYALQRELNVYRISRPELRPKAEKITVVPEPKKSQTTRHEWSIMLNLNGTGADLSDKLSGAGMLLSGDKHYVAKLTVEEV